MPGGRRPENVANIGILSTFIPNLTHPRERGGNHMRADIITLCRYNLIRELKNAPYLVLGICTWLPTGRREFWDLTVFLDTKIIPFKGSFFEINFLCGISLITASIWAKNEPLTHWIDKDMKFWNMAPRTNPLNIPKCTTIGIFLRPSTPPQVIWSASVSHGQLSELNSRYIP